MDKHQEREDDLDDLRADALREAHFQEHEMKGGDEC